MKIRRSVWLGIAAAAWLALAGCANAPAVVPLQAPPGQTLPLAAPVAIEIDPSVPQWLNSEFNGYVWTAPLAPVMQEEAFKLFQRVFSEVGPPASLQAPAVTLVIKGSTLINPLMANYYGLATATVFAGADTFARPIGAYSGEGKASAMIYSVAGVHAAFEATFAEIANRMLADPTFVERVRAQPAR